MIVDATGREVRRAIGFLRERELVTVDDAPTTDAVASATVEVPRSWTVSSPHAKGK